LRRNTKGYGGKTHWTDSQNSDITAPSVRAIPFAVLLPGGQFGNFWIHPRTILNLFLPLMKLGLYIFNVSMNDLYAFHLSTKHKGLLMILLMENGSKVDFMRIFTLCSFQPL